MTPVEIIIFAIVYVLALTFAIGALSAAPWVRTKKRQRDLVCAELSLADGATVYDLGCGDGAMLFSLARRYPDMRGIGFEIAFLPYAVGRSWKALGGATYRNVSIRYRDLFGQHYGDADAIFIFLLRPCYPRIVAKLAAEVRDDAQIIVEGWPFPGIDIERAVAGTASTMPVYFYRGAQLRRTR